MDTVQFLTSHSQRNGGKPLDTGRCEWLVSSCGHLHRVQVNRSPRE